MTRVLCIFTCLACGYRDTFASVGTSPSRCPYGCARPDLLERHDYRFDWDERPEDVAKRPKRRLPRVRVPLRKGERLEWRRFARGGVFRTSRPILVGNLGRETVCCGDPGDCQGCT